MPAPDVQIVRRSSSIFRHAASPMKNAILRDITAPGVAEEAKSHYGVRVAPITVIDDNVLYGTFADQKSRLDAVLDG